MTLRHEGKIEGRAFAVRDGELVCLDCEKAHKTRRAFASHKCGKQLKTISEPKRAEATQEGEGA